MVKQFDEYPAQTCPGFSRGHCAANGCGMSNDVRAKIFDPFFTTKEVGKGTGQGLSIAYNVVVVQHRGTLTVESEPGVGTTFIIQLRHELPPLEVGDKAA